MASGFFDFARAVWRTFFQRHNNPVRFTRARVMAMFVWLPICMVLGILHWICLLLDEVLFPGYRKVAVKAPLFIVGPPRSGTTFLHRVLTLDEERFAWFPFGEMVFMPSIVERKIGAFLGRIDDAMERPVRRWMLRTEEKYFGPYRHMHEVSLFAAEEDFVMLGYIVANHLLLAVFPFQDLFGYLFDFDHAASPERRRKILTFYRRCLQRHLYHHGTDKTHLSKNPFFTSMVASVAEEFPDAKFLCNIRDPRETVPSFCSVWDALYGGIGNDPKHYLAREFVLDWLLATYTYGGERMEALGPDRGAVVKYHELVSAPKACILKHYAAFGYTPSEAFLAALTEEEDRAAQYTSRHDYDLERYGLTEQALYDRFREVFDRYGFPAPTTPAPAEESAHA